MGKIRTAIFACTCLCFATVAQADAPGILPVQGLLTDTDGMPLQGTHTITAGIYDRLFAGSQLFSETTSGVMVQDGAFVVYVGAVGTPELDLDLFTNNENLFLQLEVDGDVIDPRFRIASVPYAVRAATCASADSLEGVAVEDLATSTHTHAFSEVTSVPADLADGDADALGGLSCQNGDVAIYTSGQWDCRVLDASDIATGILPTPRYSAHADLMAEGYLSGGEGEDLVTLSLGDSRYAIKAAADSTYVAKSTLAGATTHSIAALAAGSESINANNKTFCALTQVKHAGEFGECVITESSGDFTLTANAGPDEQTTCEMTCF